MSKKLVQTVLDAGQFKIGLDHCSECDMTFNIDQEIDVKMHEEYHNRFSSTRPLQLRSNQIDHWKREVKFMAFTTPVEGILYVIPADSKCRSIKKKVEEVVEEYVNHEVGFCDDVPTWKANRTALLFVTKVGEAKKPTQFIAGVALIDPVKEVVFQPSGVVLSAGHFVGVDRLWIHQTMRRKRLATLFSNVARRLLYPNVPIEKTKTAFNEPSGEGLQFVLAYFGNQDGKYLACYDS